MKAWSVHYQNKYPGASVVSSENSFDVFSKDGHRVALRKNGAGQWVDVSEEMGCMDHHCLAPIPKNARVKKLSKDGKIGLSEEHEQRSKVSAELAAHAVGGHGKVPSIAELEEAGEEFEPNGALPHARAWKKKTPKAE